MSKERACGEGSAPGDVRAECIDRFGELLEFGPTAREV
jgi:hypothetical protein